jgi:hypothetical protein
MMMCNAGLCVNGLLYTVYALDVSVFSYQSRMHPPSLLLFHTTPFGCLKCYRWESGQRLSRKLLLQLYTAAKAANVASTSTKELHTALDSAGGVPPSLVAAFKAVLEDPVRTRWSVPFTVHGPLTSSRPRSIWGA